MRTILCLATLWTLGAGSSAPALADDRFPPPPGRRVRVEVPSQFLHGETGTVLESDGPEIVLQLDDSGERVVLPYADISRLELSRGRSRATLLGAAGGAVLGGVLASLSGPMPSGDLDEPPDGGGGSFFLGAILGGFVGGLVGSAVRLESWDPVFSAQPFYCLGDGVGFRISAAF